MTLALSVTSGVGAGDSDYRERSVEYPSESNGRLSTRKGHSWLQTVLDYPKVVPLFFFGLWACFAAAAWIYVTVKNNTQDFGNVGQGFGLVESAISTVALVILILAFRKEHDDSNEFREKVEDGLRKLTEVAVQLQLAANSLKDQLEATKRHDTLEALLAKRTALEYELRRKYNVFDPSSDLLDNDIRNLQTHLDDTNTAICKAAEKIPLADASPAAPRLANVSDREPTS